MRNHPDLRGLVPMRGFAPVTIVMALTAALGVTACGGGETADDASPETVEQPAAPIAVSAEDAAAVAELAQPVAMTLARTLQTNLVQAMQESGPVGAMEFCNVEALPLTQQVSEEQGMVVKRTSWQLRNPANTPDALEVAALAHFAEAYEASGGAIPEDWVQADPGGGFRYYKALPTAAPCLNCHGNDEQLAPGVAEALAELYPQDQATGFSEGQMRGLLRVAVPASALHGG